MTKQKSYKYLLVSLFLSMPAIGNDAFLCVVPDVVKHTGSQTQKSEKVLEKLVILDEKIEWRGQIMATREVAGCDVAHVDTENPIALIIYCWQKVPRQLKETALFGDGTILRNDSYDCYESPGA